MEILDKIWCTIHHSMTTWGCIIHRGMSIRGCIWHHRAALTFFLNPVSDTPQNGNSEVYHTTRNGALAAVFRIRIRFLRIQIFFTIRIRVQIHVKKYICPNISNREFLFGIICWNKVKSWKNCTNNEFLQPIWLAGSWSVYRIRIRNKAAIWIWIHLDPKHFSSLFLDPS